MTDEARRHRPAAGIALPDGVVERIVSSILSVVDAEAVYVFGSYARGEQGPDSDIDIFVVADDDSAHTTALVLCELDWLRMHKDLIMERRELFDRGSKMFGHVEADVANEGVMIYGRPDRQ